MEAETWTSLSLVTLERYNLLGASLECCRSDQSLAHREICRLLSSRRFPELCSGKKQPLGRCNSSNYRDSCKRLPVAELGNKSEPCWNALHEELPTFGFCPQRSNVNGAILLHNSKFHPALTLI